MDRQAWNNLVKKHAPRSGAFLSSYEWGEFQRSLGRKVARVRRIGQSGEMLAQAVKMDLPLGQFYWLISKGPNGTMSLNEMIKILRDELPEATFLRLEPAIETDLLQVPDVQPSTTVMIDLTAPSETILQAMKSKTRYNIRLAERKGVVCRRVGLDYFDDFIRLMEQTTHRDRFRAHPDAYYRAMLETMSSGECRAFLAMAFYEERPLAANLVIDFHDVRTYLHGATSNLHRNVMAQYALHHHLIEDAKRAGLAHFDFWGIAPDGAPESHPWFGITRYKKGYGGEVVSAPGTFDLPIKHIVYSGYRNIRRLRRLANRQK